MARPPRSPDRRGDGRDRASSRRPGEASGPIRRTPQRGRARGEFSSDSSRRQTPQRRTPRRESDRPVPASARSGRVGTGRVGTTAHPEAHRLTTRTDLSSTLLGPRNYTPRRIGLLAVIAIILLVTVSFPLRNHYQSLGEQKAVAQERVALEQTIAELEAEQKLLEDPAFIEQQARIRFGAVKPGETPYRVSMEDPVEKAEAERRQAEIEALPWQTRVWNSIAEPNTAVMPEQSTLPDPTTSDPAASDPGADPAAPDAGTPAVPDVPSQEDPPA